MRCIPACLDGPMMQASCCLRMIFRVGRAFFEDSARVDIGF